MKKKRNSSIKAFALAVVLLLGGFLGKNFISGNNTSILSTNVTWEQSDGSLEPSNISDKTIQESIPKYSDSPYCNVNKGKPTFTQSEITTKSYEKLGELDSMGRCTSAMACLGEDLMPSESQERGSISEIHPTGWRQVMYKSVTGEALYNRCHIIGWQLTGNDAVEENLITGTQYMNNEGMEPYESKIAQYIRSSGNHVMYRVTPVFKGKEKVARGVHMEAYSVEDKGSGISFNIYCYNVQPNISINYATGESESNIEDDCDGYTTSRNGKTYYSKNLKDSSKTQSSNMTNSNKISTSSSGSTKSDGYVLNTNTMRFHYSTCNSVKNMSSRNMESTNKSREELIKEGYTPCGSCNP